MACSFLTVYDVTAVVRIEITWVAENLQEAADALFGLLLCFLLHIDGLMGLVKVSKDSVNQLEKFERCFVVKLHHTQVAHEGWSVQTINDDFNLGRV